MKNLKNLSRRGLALLLTLVMCLGMLQLTVFAIGDEPETFDGPPTEDDYGIEEQGLFEDLFHHRHNWVEIEKIPATCTESGKLVQECSAWYCSEVRKISNDEELALGHDHSVVQESVAATCGTDGYTVYKCSRCEDTITEPISATGEHTYEEGVCTVCGAEDPEYTGPVEPSCEHSNHTYKDNGDGTHSVVCADCDATVGEPVAHEYTNGNCVCGATEPVDPNPDTGEKTRVYVYVRIEGPTEGWTPNDQGWYTIGYVDVPTATLEQAADRKVFDEAKDNQREAVVSLLATNLVRYPANKDMSFNLSDVDWNTSDGIYDLHVRAGASSYDVSGNQWHLDGLLDLTKPSDETYTATVKYEDADGKQLHEPDVKHDIKAGGSFTVTLPEIKGYTPREGQGIENNQVTVKIANADNSITVVYVKDQEPHTHSYTEEITKEPTCEEPGEKTFTCDCGDSYTEAIKPLGHAYPDEWTVTKEPTCTVMGTKERVCSRNSSHVDTQEIAAPGHHYDETTWEHDDSKHWHECTVCHDKKTEKLHMWLLTQPEIEVDATCTLPGWAEFKCTECSATKRVTTNALGHAFSDEWEKDNENHWHECTRCGSHQGDAPHTFTDWVDFEVGSCTKMGVKMRSCTECGYTEYNVINPNGHDWGDWKDQGDGTHKSECQNEGCDVFKTELHIWGEWSEADDEGYHTRKCTADCGATERVKHEANVKAATDTESKLPTCTEDGLEVRYCQYCGESEKHVLTAPGHDYGEWESVDTAEHKHVCSRDTTHVETAAHRFGGWTVTKPATATEAGTSMRVCTDCGQAEYRTIPATGGGSTTTYYTLTVRYQDANGNKLSDDKVVENLEAGSEQTESAISISGYRISGSDTQTVTMDGDKVITFTYARRSSGGGGGGGSSRPSTPSNPGSTEPPVVDIPDEEPPLVDVPDVDDPVVDTPVEPPVVDIPDEEPPLVDLPDEEPPLVDIPDEEPPLVDIPDEEPPLVDVPDVDNVEPPVVEIPENTVPLSDVPKTGDSSGIWTVLALLSAAGLLGLTVYGRKKREEI